MSDTIDLLQAIGQDASLRHASAEELTEVLAQAQASKALSAAVAFGDSSRLFEEFGYVKNLAMEGTLSPAHEEDPDGEEPLDVPVPDETPDRPEK